MKSSKAALNPYAKNWTRIDLESIASSHVLIMGLGQFGGGVAAARFFAERNCHVLVTDLQDARRLESSIAALDTLPITFRLGEHCEQDFIDADILIVNPAIPPTSKYLAIAAAHGAQFSSEMNLFFERCPRPIIAVTGSNGKSTTSTLIHKILTASGIRSFLGGNIGTPLLNERDIFDATNGWVILELSSFQLYALDPLHYAPHIAVCTNISPNHLDWHPDYAHYIACKKTITRHQTSNDILVLNHDDSELMTWAADSRATINTVSTSKQSNEFPSAWMHDDELFIQVNDSPPTQLCTREQVQLPGDFNISNFLIASLAALHAEATVEACVSVAKTFGGLEHRLQNILHHNSIDYINDSISTTPESSIAALSAMQNPTLLILGGYDKGSAFDALAHAIATSPVIKHVILLGACAAKIQESLAAATRSVPIKIADDFDSAVRMACALARPGDTVLLSPACASYDHFQNFQERAKRFSTLVHECLNQSTL